jgi:hypothetical protein
VNLPAAGFAPVRTGVIYVGTTQGVSLRDDKDKALPAQVTIDFQKARGGNVEWVMVYTPQKGQGTPTKVVFSGRRTVTVNIPFTLKDVKLP